MRADLRKHLLAVAHGELSSKTGVTHVTGVTDRGGYVPKLLELQRLRGLRVENHNLENDLKNGVTEPVTCGTNLEDSVSERLAIIEDDGAVPSVFRIPWAYFNCHRPSGVSEDDWMNAIVIGGLLLEAWGERAAELGWQGDDLFAYDTGLVWKLADCGGSAVVALDRLEPMLPLQSTIAIVTCDGGRIDPQPRRGVTR